MKILDIPRSGSFAGVTSSHNRAGQYVRNRRTPTNAPTTRRTVMRSNFAAASSGWAALTDAERAAWTSAAATHPVTDRLGSSIFLTGQQLYVSVATQLLNLNQALPTTPPADFSVYSVGTASMIFSLATGWSVGGIGGGSASDFVIIQLSPPMSAGRTFWSKWTQVLTDAGNITPESDTTAHYSAQFGAPVIGQKVFARITPVNQYGVTGVSAVVSTLVTA